MISLLQRVAGVLVATVCGCAGTVVVEGEDGAADPGGDGAGAAQGGGGCVACEEGDCGFCDDPGSGLLIYRCPTLELPDGYADCFQTGSLFHDDAFGYYVCWRCGPL